MASVEEPKDFLEQGVEATPEASVGVFGWLGFIIINVAAWGIITTASWISWIFGFAICFVYTAVLIGLAVWLKRRGDKYDQFVNLLWVLAAWFIFILGIYISVQIIGRLADDGTFFADDGSSGSVPSNPNDVTSLLPDNASQELRAWASSSDWAGSTFAAFNGSIFFSGRGQGGATNVNTLQHVVGSNVSGVVPELTNAQSFVEFRSALYFAASASGGQQLWSIGPGKLSDAEQVSGNDPRKLNFRVRYGNLFVDEGASLLYFKANYNLECPGACSAYTWVDTILQSNGSANGTVDLRADPCASARRCSGGTTSSSKPPVATLWGVLFVAALPMTALAAFVLIKLKLPGLSVNIFGGVLCAAVTLYLIAHYDDDSLDGFPSFLKWFITIYTSMLWVGLVAWSLRAGTLAPWLEELKTWAVTVIGVAFFVVIHIDLEVPFTTDAWRWIVYALLALLQIVISAAVSRPVPMVAGAIGIFVISWKIAYEIVEFADFGGSELKMLTMMAILALQGIGIIAAAIFYAGNRGKIDGLVRKALTCGKSPN